MPLPGCLTEWWYAIALDGPEGCPSLRPLPWASAPLILRMTTQEAFTCGKGAKRHTKQMEEELSTIATLISIEPHRTTGSHRPINGFSVGVGRRRHKAGSARFGWGNHLPGRYDNHDVWATFLKECAMSSIERIAVLYDYCSRITNTCYNHGAGRLQRRRTR